ncbi:MAG: AAA family ATPase [Thermoplasmata archaeon]|nr:AAA family ATPase [Thermoplasmata archaeon]
MAGAVVELSEEQQRFVDEALAGRNILVDACIGSGKTTAIQSLCNAFPVTTMVLYLTYNRLLKADAQARIQRPNVVVTNYHGFAGRVLARNGISAGKQDLIQTFLRSDCDPGRFDVLVLDEYQDIEQEIADMLVRIKEANPWIQIVAVGDMAQKIYDKTTLDVEPFVASFLGDHIRLEFTTCFRLPPAHAAMLGRVWGKRIVGVNDGCKIVETDQRGAERILAGCMPGDILCLGARTGVMPSILNNLERRHPDRFNKNTVYASIQDRDAGVTEPNPSCAVFTTYDSSKGMERRVCVVCNFDEDYWDIRLDKPGAKYEILRNTFCVAASRGKGMIVFVTGRGRKLTEKVLATPVAGNTDMEDVDISGMFDFKYREDIERCYSMLQKTRIPVEDSSPIDIPTSDGLIDLSPCIGIYQEAAFFEGYDINRDLDMYFQINKDQAWKNGEKLRKARLDTKILALVSLETRQDRYLTQVTTPIVKPAELDAILARLGTVLSPKENVQVGCVLHFGKGDGSPGFSAMGYADAVRDGTVYELKFVSELSHEHFLQCACYMAALKLERGVLWNVRTNEMHEIRIPDSQRFLDQVARTVTKGAYSSHVEKKRGSGWDPLGLFTSRDDDGDTFLHDALLGCMEASRKGRRARPPADAASSEATS